MSLNERGRTPSCRQPAGPSQHKRYADGRLVKRDAFDEQPVIAELIAVSDMKMTNVSSASPVWSSASSTRPI